MEASDSSNLTRAGGDDAHPTIWGKAAALLQSIAGNHALVDGNERLGWLATAVFLELDGASVARSTNDEVYELVMGVASSALDLGRIIERLEDMGRS